MSWSEHAIDNDFDGARTVRTADMDGDGDVDVLGAALDANEIAWWSNQNGTGLIWEKYTVDASFTRAAYVAAGDVDGDGDLDLVGCGFTLGTVSWWENIDGFATAWTKHPLTTSLNLMSSVEVCDLDGDGDLDILGAARNSDTVVWWENTNGKGTIWLERYIDTVMGGPHSAFAADMDYDGDLDVFVAGSFGGDEISWFENLDGAAGSWDKHLVDADFDVAAWVVAGDVDRDCDLDVIGGAWNGDEVAWWDNVDGAGTIWTKHSLQTDFTIAASVFVSDLDDDGDLDVLGAARWGDRVSWWENLIEPVALPFDDWFFDPWWGDPLPEGTNLGCRLDIDWARGSFEGAMFGYWGSPHEVEPITADTLYHGVWTVESQVAPADCSPFRMRVNASNWQQANVLEIFSWASGSQSPPEEYHSYWAPPSSESAAGQSWYYSFDLTHYDSSDLATGTITLRGFEVERLAIPSGQTITTYTVGYAGDGWTPYTLPDISIPLMRRDYGDRLRIQSQGDTLNTFGWWQGPTLGDIVGGRLYRMSFAVSAIAVEQSRVPFLRLRVNVLPDGESAAWMVVESIGSGANSPSPAPRPYLLYYWAPTGLDWAGRGLAFSFDAGSFYEDDDPYGAFFLHGLTVEAITLTP